MKKFLFFIIHLIISSTTDAQQQWQWTNMGNNTNDGLGNSLTTDISGNIYVTGSFSGVFTIGTVTLTSSGGSDIFVAKYNAAGQLQWAKKAGGNGDDKGSGIAVDSYGNVCIFGTFSSTAYFEDSTFTSTGGSDLYLVKFDNNGNQLFAKKWGTVYAEFTHKISIDGNDNLYLTGGFGATSNSGSISINFDQVTLASHGKGDVFIVKLDMAGTIKWAKNAGSSFGDAGFNICADILGNVYVSGICGGTTMYFNNVSLPSCAMFLAKYDSSGNALWAKGLNSNDPGDFQIYHTIDGYNIYITGYYFSPSVNIGTTTLSNGNNAPKGFIAKYNTSGDVVWAKHMSNAYTDAGLGIALDASSNIYVGGYLAYSGVYGQDTLTTTGGHDILAAKYDSNGNSLWGVKAGGAYNNEAYDIALDNAGNILLTGYVMNTAHFGPHTITSQGGWDMFVAKLSQSTGVRQVGGKDNSINVYPNPANGEVIVKLDGNYETALLYDIGGRMVYSAAVKGKKELSIDTKGFAGGVYVLQVSGDAGNKQSKIVIE